jgi:hypothetical protein
VLLKLGNEQNPEAETVEQRLRAALETLVPAKTISATQTTEELAILKRWYYRTHKTGEIVFAKLNGELPMRKVVNAVNRIINPKPKTETTEDTKEHEGIQAAQDAQLDGNASKG